MKPHVGHASWVAMLCVFTRQHEHARTHFGKKIDIITLIKKIISVETFRLAQISRILIMTFY